MVFSSRSEQQRKDKNTEDRSINLKGTKNLKNEKKMNTTSCRNMYNGHPRRKGEEGYLKKCPEPFKLDRRQYISKVYVLRITRLLKDKEKPQSSKGEATDSLCAGRPPQLISHQNPYIFTDNGMACSECQEKGKTVLYSVKLSFKHQGIIR